MIKRYEGVIKLSVLLIIVPLFAYKLGVSRTVSQWRKYRSDQSQIRLLESMDNVPKVSTTQHSDLLNSGDLLKIISPNIEKNGLSVDLYIPYLTDTSGITILRSAEIVLRGGFIPLLETIHALEHDIPQVSLRSLEFASSNNLREREMQLRATLTVQQITHRE